MADFRQVQICVKPVFIIGAERSGSTILALALGQHSALWYSCEGHLFPGLFEPRRLEKIYSRGLYRYRWIQEEGVSKAEFYESVGIGINALFTSRSQGRRWIDKTLQNTLFAEVLACMFPGACFIHILRDGRKVVQSMTHFLTNTDQDVQSDRVHDGMAPRWADNFRFACKTWRQYVQSATELEKLHPDRCLTVRNEDLVADPEPGFREITRFLGLGYEAAPSEFFRSHRINSSFPEDSEHLLSDPWNTWTLQQKRVFLEEAADMLVQLGMAGRDEIRQMEEDAH